MNKVSQRHQFSWYFQGFFETYYLQIQIHFKNLSESEFNPGAFQQDHSKLST